MSKKSKSKPAEALEPAEKGVQTDGGDAAPDHSDQSDGGIVIEKPKKRKREEKDDDLEIDLSRPEPPNKRLLRKAKKLEKAGKHEEAKALLDQGNPARDAENDPVAETEFDLPGENPSEVTKEVKPAKPKVTHSIWIGNLPFAATKVMLTDFLVNNSQPPISKESVVRVNVPAPANAKATKTTIKPMNKGFAYVDFSDEQSFMAALALSESQLGGRNLLIKNAKSFEGRPAEHQTKQKSGTNKAVSRRVFVGNLGFDVTVADLERLFEKCGPMEHVHMATFEDTGKCKGFAWITFTTEDAATSAVKGVTIEEVPAGEEDDEADEVPDGEQKAKKRKPKKRQWWCNRLNGREVRREYAEDPSVRYNKRFGKGKREPAAEQAAIAEVSNEEVAAEQPVPAKQDKKHPYGLNPGAPTDPQKRRGRSEVPIGKSKMAQEIAEKTRYRSGQIADSEGTKVTFD